MIVFVTKDLFFIPLLKSAAEKLNCSLVTIPNLTSPRFSDIAAQEVTACVVDLTALKVAEIDTTAQLLKTRFASAQLIAFGPHVQDAQLVAAQSAGFGSVLTRGQLNAHIDRYMQQWSMPAPS